MNSDQVLSYRRLGADNNFRMQRPIPVSSSYRRRKRAAIISENKRRMMRFIPSSSEIWRIKMSTVISENRRKSIPSSWSGKSNISFLVSSNKNWRRKTVDTSDNYWRMKRSVADEQVTMKWSGAFPQCRGKAKTWYTVCLLPQVLYIQLYLYCCTQYFSILASH